MAFQKFTAVAMPEPQYVAKVNDKKAWEYARQCDLANHQHDEEKAERYAKLAVEAAGYATEREVRRTLGLNVAYYYFEYGITD